MKKIAARVTSGAEAATCRVVVPKKSRGKVPKITLTTTLNGKSVKKSFATKAR